MVELTTFVGLFGGGPLAIALAVIVALSLYTYRQVRAHLDRCENEVGELRKAATAHQMEIAELRVRIAGLEARLDR